MKVHELSKPLTANALNESLGKNFGQKLRLESFTLSQLEDARNRLRTQLADVETNESFETVHNSDAYQKGKLFLDTINKEIAERDEWVTEADKDPQTDFTKWLKGTHDKGVRELKGNEYVKMSKEYQAQKGKKKDEAVVKEGAEESAQLVMAAKDMVDRVTGWMEDTAEMQTESMLELGDAIRDELGSEMSEQFINTVKPALEQLYTTFEGTREALTGGVAIITGEGGPEVMPGEEGEAPAEDPAMEPVDDTGEAPAEEPVADEFGASEPATGGEEIADREKRESVERSRRLGNILSTESAPKKKS
jgi:hypothetical protein